ncbi:phosphate acetyltransferase [Candidatus Peregrinibacteria bacterium RIFOXYC2_FULL_33_13]|nr:MAG: Phosphate acetyltransferase [Candidatus Peregrinibacteria bacterium GW2011_GWA2_33_10]KKP40819.1 MAG: phosphate acetyltransferase, phosphate acetyltransferase [Candidatus Peregrinibacteria bacterium GW2011_GWC2_33_13]OGJ48022.1 MAG: phosphate acetyltransferase [Candidatus Peregrinibacteria bacterium RIFOXYA2_FULL_33_7]OGJ52408.1 MAG: phosphate acetyltransferase [Candidatus Peregrinibacteria bacterium RIFOXYC2_FULL_33_13]
MKKFLKKLKNKAKKNQKTIVFAESEDIRVLSAIKEIINQNLCRPILLGNLDNIKEILRKHRLKLNLQKIQIINHLDNDFIDHYAKKLFKIRNGKIKNLMEAQNLLKDPNYFGTMMINEAYADAMISGNLSPTNKTILPALQIIKTKEKFHKVSGLFIMMMEKKLIFFADCAVMTDPNSHDLAEIAIDTAKTAKKMGIEPKIAMLSFSTNGSGDHPTVDKMREATLIAKEKAPKLIIEGEMQVDAALNKEVCAQKFPNSKIQGDANILIFPDLNSANIAYKLVQRLAKAEAIGPILQGLKKPINDLSRGCDAEDIVNLTAITAVID